MLTSLLVGGLLLGACAGGEPNPGTPDAGTGPAPGGDTTPPAAPVLTRSEPASPANDNAPRLVGTAEPGSRVRLYATPACDGAVVAEVTADASGAFSATVDVSDNSTNFFTATATDAAGNVSACGASLTYREDSATLLAPVLAGTTPVSPANDNAPRVFGTAPAGSIVRLFTSASCAGVPVSQATADGSGGFSTTVSVAGDSTTLLYANATTASGQTSGCSAVGLEYREDSLAPERPTLASSAPASPANDNAPRLVGTAEAGATVRIYTASSCAGTPVAQGTVDAAGAFSLPLSVADDTATTLHASATDAAGNTSACSAGFTYREDSLAPSAPTFVGTQPAAPANNNRPGVTGHAEPLSTVLVFTSADCAGAPAAEGVALASGDFHFSVDVRDDATTPLSARARDASGNLSSCASGPAYQEDSTPPALPTLTDSTPTSPANANTLNLQGTTEPGGVVRIYTTATCTGTQAGEATASASGAFSVSVGVAENSTTHFYASAMDVAGNASACSAGFTYVEDSAAAPPTFTGTTPASPANDTAPRLQGETEPRAHVRLYAAAGCAGPVAGEGAADASGRFSLSVSVRDDTTSSFSANVTDVAGNLSPCTATSLSYVEDSTAPGPPVVSSSPASPANHNAPELSGTTGAGDTVRLYTSSDCSGSPLANVVASSTGSFSATVNVPDDSRTSVYAVLTDRAGNASGCMKVLEYQEDSIAPAVPSLTGTSPVSPANNNHPSFQGSTEPGVTLLIHLDTACTGEPVTSFRIDEPTGAFSIPVPVGDDSTTAFSTRARDAAGNTSACTPVALTYVEDSTGPSVAAASVLDGEPGTPDAAYLNSTTRVSAKWSGFTDAHGIARYEYSLSSMQSCPGSVITPRSVGAVTSVAVTGGPLTERFYVNCVRAVDSAGNASAWTFSDGFFVDVTPPKVVSTYPTWSIASWDHTSVKFSESRIDPATVSIQVTVDGKPVAGKVSCQADTCTFQPDRMLPYSRRFIATLAPGVKDLAGNGLTTAGHTWDFYTRTPAWFDPVPLQSTWAEEPSLALDDQGRTFLLFSDYAQSGSWRRFRGGGWESAPDVSLGAGVSEIDPPVVATSPEGRLVAVMTGVTSGVGGANAYGLSADASMSWSPATHLGAPTKLRVKAPRVAADVLGNGVALWFENGPSDTSLWVNPYTHGAGWGAPLRLRTIASASWTDASHGYDLAVDASGKTVVVWAEPGTGFLFARYTPGQGWSAPQAGTALDGLRPRVAFSADGTGVVVWESSTVVDGTRVTTVHASHSTTQSGFGAPLTVHQGNIAAGTARVGMDAQGNAFALWLQGTAGNELWAARYVKGSGWEAPQQLDTSVALAELAVRPSGAAMVVYGHTVSSNTLIRTRRHEPDMGWTDIFRLDSYTLTGAVDGLKVVTNGNGTIAAAWIRYVPFSGPYRMYVAHYE
jgi:hypothetical protein